MSAETMREAAGILVEFEEVLRPISDVWDTTCATVQPPSGMARWRSVGTPAEFVPLPRWTAGELQPLVIGHLRAHLEQAKEMLRVRAALPEAVTR